MGNNTHSKNVYTISPVATAIVRKCKQPINTARGASAESVRKMADTESSFNPTDLGTTYEDSNSKRPTKANVSAAISLQ